VPTTRRSGKLPQRRGQVDRNKVIRTRKADLERQIAEDPDTAPELTEEALDRAVIVTRDGSRIPYRERVPRPQGGDLLKPGARAPRSGHYEIIARSGAGTGEERLIASGRPLPPTPEPGQRYRLLTRGVTERGA
jgi:hypothetical protein